jgi:hypothetical protein
MKILILKNFILVLLIIFVNLSNKFVSIEDFKLDNYIDQIYYINLADREDRKISITNELKKLGLNDNKITRIEAVYEKGRGHLGCTKSHIKAIEMFLQSGKRNCIVFEDDFKFKQTLDFIKEKFFKLFNYSPDYDVCMLSTGWESSKKIKDKDYLKKSDCTTTASAYLVTRNFAPRLLENFKEGLVLLEQAYNRGSKIDGTGDAWYALDQYWCKLHSVSNWYIFDPVLGSQGEFSSNIS